MAHHNRFKQNRKKPARRPSPSVVVEKPAFVIPARKPPTTYGKPFIVLEDGQKNTFEYLKGAWVPYSISIAQCRESGEVKELPQKINKMTRYEVRLPLL